MERPEPFVAAAPEARGDGVDEHAQRRRHLALAWVAEEEAGEGGCPVFEQRHEPTVDAVIDEIDRWEEVTRSTDFPSGS